MPLTRTSRGERASGACIGRRESQGDPVSIEQPANLLSDGVDRRNAFCSEFLFDVSSPPLCVKNIADMEKYHNNFNYLYRISVNSPITAGMDYARKPAA